MSETEKFREYARRITHETFKFELRAKWRREKARDAKSWYRLDSISCKRFVLKITRMIEGFR